MGYCIVPAVIACFICMFLTEKNEVISFSDIINILAFKNTYFGVDSFMDYIALFFPILFFQVWNGSYIYQHYGTASVYFFSRQQKRIPWYCKEAGKLYFMGLCYLLAEVGAAVLYVRMFVQVSVDERSWILFGYYLIIYSLWLFGTTLSVNLLSILWNSVKAFSVVVGTELFCISLYVVWDKWMDFSFYDGTNMQAQILALKCNPFSCLIFRLHSSTIEALNLPYNQYGFTYGFSASIIGLLIFCILCFIIGIRIVISSEVIQEKE